MHEIKRQRTTIAVDLGTVLASEALCGLTYNQAAIQAFIAKNVPARDMGFPDLLVGLTQVAELQNQSMSESAVTAHCAQIARIAESYGFNQRPNVLGADDFAHEVAHQKAMQNVGSK